MNKQKGNIKIILKIKKRINKKMIMIKSNKINSLNVLNNGKIILKIQINLNILIIKIYIIKKW